MTFGAFLEIGLAVAAVFGWYVFLHYLSESLCRDPSLVLTLRVADKSTADNFRLLYREARRSFLCRHGGRVAVLLYRSVADPALILYLEEHNIDYDLWEDR